MDIAGAPAANLPRMMARKNEVVKTLVAGVEGLLAAGKVKLLRGEGRLAGQREDVERRRWRRVSERLGSSWPAVLCPPGCRFQAMISRGHHFH